MRQWDSWKFLKQHLNKIYSRNKQVKQSERQRCSSGYFKVFQVNQFNHLSKSCGDEEALKLSLDSPLARRTGKATRRTSTSVSASVCMRYQWEIIVTTTWNTAWPPTISVFINQQQYFKLFDGQEASVQTSGLEWYEPLSWSCRVLNQLHLHPHL